MRKLKTSVSRLEGQIEDLEDEIALLEERLNCNPPYEEFLKISAELQQNPSNAILLMKIGLKNRSSLPSFPKNNSYIKLKTVKII